MAKKGPNRNLNNNSIPSTRWEDTLPSVYQTLLDKFNADMTVEEMMSYLKVDQMRDDLEMDPVEIPEEIRKIKIGCFTTNIFEHEKYRDFWKTPVTSYHLCSFPSVFKALHDPDIAQVQKESLGYHVDAVHPDLETLVRVAQMQYLGFNLRMSELTSNSMMARLHQLKQPKEYEKMRDLAKRYKVNLPKDVPEFSFVHQETSIKQIGSAAQKADARTGKPKNLQAFLANPNAYGVNGVNDMKRTMIQLSGDRKNQMANYIAVRDLMTVAFESGYLGMVVSEISDQVLHPSSSRPSDLNPVLMVKGEMYHAGPIVNGQPTMLRGLGEAQIALMQDHAVQATHDLYKISRQEGVTPETQHTLDDARLKIFDSELSDEVKAQRAEFLKTGKPKDDPISKLIVARGNGFDMTRHSSHIQKNAIMCAYREFPEEVGQPENIRKENIVDITLNSKDTAVHQALRMMIQKDEVTLSPAQQRNQTVYSNRVTRVLTT